MTAARPRRPVPRPPCSSAPTASRCRSARPSPRAYRSAFRARSRCSNWRTRNTASCRGASCSSRPIALARDGFAVSPRARLLARHRSSRSRNEPAARADLLQCRWRAQEAGRTRRQSGAGRHDAAASPTTVPRLSTRARLAQEMVARVHGHVRPGTLSLADLAAYKPIKREALCGPYRVWMVCGMPPPSSGGVAILQIAGAARAVRALARTSPTTCARCISSPRRAGSPSPIARAIVADPAFVPVPVAGLLAPSYIAERRKLISLDHSMGRAGAGRGGLCRARHQPHDHRRSRRQCRRLHHHHRIVVRRADDGGRLHPEQRADRFLGGGRTRRPAGRQPGRARQAAALVDVADLRARPRPAGWSWRWARPAASASSATPCMR